MKANNPCAAPLQHHMEYLLKLGKVHATLVTKNVTDSLFNSLKHEYCKKNLFTMQDFFLTLNVSDSVMVVPMIPEDFLDYNVLTDNVYSDLSGMVKQNHMFSCHDDGNDTII
jgi:hypothetical protein